MRCVMVTAACAVMELNAEKLSPQLFKVAVSVRYCIEKFGFEQRPCEYDGAGMMKMLRAK